MADEQRSPVDQALDLILFAPVGLALTAKDELPRLIEKGRQRVEAQVTMLRMIGKFAVSQGQREAEKATTHLVQQAGVIAERLGAVGGVPGAAGPVPARPEPTGPARRAAESIATPTSTASGSDRATRDAAGGAGAAGAAGEAEASPRAGAVSVSANGTAGNGRSPDHAGAETLAIPGYDSLSASQVVQRLAGLLPAELAEVGRYEDAHRGRRTILSKVAQLQTDRS